MQQQQPGTGQEQSLSAQPLGLDIGSLAALDAASAARTADEALGFALSALDAALARDHAAQARAERAQARAKRAQAKTPWEEQGVHVSVWVSEALL